MTLSLAAFVVTVVLAGTAVIVHSAALLSLSMLNGYVIALAALTVVSGRFAIKVPGRAATVSVSEVFVFASILLFGPPVAVLTVTFDGLWISLTQRHRRFYRAMFNIAEPAISTWAAAHIFFAIAGTTPGASLSTTASMVAAATIAMAGVFFALNSGLSALAVALENGTSALEFWRSHAWYLAVNYYAAASLATLAVSSGPRINFGVAGLVIPLLLLSYVAYREAASRLDEAHRHVIDVERLYRASVEMLAIAVDAKDQVTHGHIRRVQRHTLAVASGLGVTDPRELKAIEAGALLHDIGKLAVPDYVLNKPSALTSAEFEIIKKHATMGARILKAVEFPYPIVPIVRHHHERWDGRGYPDGLVGLEIPLGARILAVVDCFDALTSDRPYRPRLSDERAIEILRARQGTFYDAAVVQKFIELIPGLRRDDEVPGEQPRTRASVLAGLAGATGAHEREALVLAPRPATAVPAVLQECIDRRLAAVAGAEACLFGFSTAQDGLVVVHATPRLRVAVGQLQLPVGSGVSGWVAANRSSIRHADPALDLPELVTLFSLKSCAAIPVFVRAELFGVLTLYATDAVLPDPVVDEMGMLAQEVGLLIARAGTPVAHHHLGRAGRQLVAAAS